MNTRLLRSEHQRRVDEFMRLAKQNVPDQPVELDEKTRILRAKLILEEALETIRDGLGVDVVHIDGGWDADRIVISDDEATFDFKANRPFDLIETIDGCCDISVVTTGTFTACGIPDEPFQKLVDYNNLAKFGPGHSIREDGKLIKPPGHKPPDIAGKLAELVREV